MVLFLMMIAIQSFGQSSDFYDFNVKTLEGDNFDLNSLKGKR